MEELYLEIRTVHIWAVTASGLVFAMRGGAFNLLDARWPKALPIRLLSWTIDTILLTAALMLMTAVHQYPFVDSWLTVKLLMLVAYIGLGTLAFAAARSRRARIGFWIAALVVFGFIVTVARTHDPLGLLSGIAG